jgi:hypothetical protein
MLGKHNIVNSRYSGTSCAVVELPTCLLDPTLALFGTVVCGHTGGVAELWLHVRGIGNHGAVESCGQPLVVFCGLKNHGHYKRFGGIHIFQPPPCEPWSLTAPLLD